MNARTWTRARRDVRAGSMQRLHPDDGGAIVVFGVFFAVLALGLLYYLVGIAATIYLRERLQDAADASAFASAIVHARGMNTLALINMVMAAILSVLVTLRLVEALIIVAEVILYALSWLGGATAAIASALEAVRQTVHEVAEEAEPIIHQVIEALHMAGDVVRVVTPIGSNAGVLTNVRDNYQPEVSLVVAMPPRLTLPVQDDTFNYLCEKAGKMAAKLALLPLSPILPNRIESKIQDLAGKLTGGGSLWFCGEGDPPSVDVETDPVPYPRNEDSERCFSRDKGGQDSYETCKRAERFQALSEPGPNGECRVGQPVCTPVLDGEEPPTVLQFSDKSYCGSEAVGKMVMPDDCSMAVQDGKPVSPYGQRLGLAREQCQPAGDIQDYKWQERELMVTWERDPTTGQWKEVGEPVEIAPPTYVEQASSGRAPCQLAALDPFMTAPTFAPWNTSQDLAQPVCKVDEPIGPLDPDRVQKHRTEVVQVVGCSKAPSAGKVSVPVEPLNVGEDRLRDVGITNSGEAGGSSDVGGVFGDVKLDGADRAQGGQGGQSGQNGQNGQGGQSGEESSLKPFRFEEGHKLGTSDMQIRSLVLGRKLDDSELDEGHAGPEEGETAHAHAERVVKLTKWQSSGDELTSLEDMSEVWGMFAVAQAEYFFAVDSPSASGFADWKGKDGERDYLWYMGWTARMRRFRLSFTVDGESADGKSESGASSSENSGLVSQFGGGGLSGFTQLPQGDPAAQGPAALCSGDGMCGQATQFMQSSDGLFLH